MEARQLADKSAEAARVRCDKLTTQLAATEDRLTHAARTEAEAVDAAAAAQRGEAGAETQLARERERLEELEGKWQADVARLGKDKTALTAIIQLREGAPTFASLQAEARQKTTGDRDRSSAAKTGGAADDKPATSSAPQGVAAAAAGAAAATTGARGKRNATGAFPYNR